MNGLFNHGAYKMFLQQKIEELVLKLTKTKDPYEQWNIKEQRKLAELFLKEYNRIVEEQLGLREVT